VQALLDYFDITSGQMGTNVSFIARGNRYTYVVEVSAAGALRARPISLTRVNVDEVDQRTSGAQLHHPEFGEFALDTASENIAVKTQCLAHSADQEQDMVDAFQCKWWKS
jgi:hypothetical protein